MLLFGTGGQLVEVMRDRALALPPLNTTLARRMMEQTTIFKALQGVRGRAPVDLGALEQLVVRFSQLVARAAVDQGDRHQSAACVERRHDSARRAGDACTTLTPMSTALPKIAIRPYPTQYVAPWTLKDGTPVTIRPIRPEDEPLMVAFHKTLSEQSVYMRYFRPLALDWRVTHERLTRICFNDYDREIALVADQRDPASGAHHILAVGRLTKLHRSHGGEFALLISDACQGQGLGTELLRRLIDVGHAEQLERIVGYILPENHTMLAICRQLGFQITHDNQMMRAVKELGSDA